MDSTSGRESLEISAGMRLDGYDRIDTACDPALHKGAAHPASADEQ